MRTSNCINIFFSIFTRGQNDIGLLLAKIRSIWLHSKGHCLQKSLKGFKKVTLGLRDY